MNHILFSKYFIYLLNLLKFIDRIVWVSFEGAEPVCIKINETPLKVPDVKKKSSTSQDAPIRSQVVRNSRFLTGATEHTVKKSFSHHFLHFSLFWLIVTWDFIMVVGFEQRISGTRGCRTTTGATATAKCQVPIYEQVLPMNLKCEAESEL